MAYEIRVLHQTVGEVYSGAQISILSMLLDPIRGIDTFLKRKT